MFCKLKEKVKGAIKKVSYALPLAGGMLSVPGITALADESGTTVSSTDWASVISAMTGQVSVSTVVGVLATAVSASIGLVFLWWGVRKATRVLFGAFRKGKLSV